MKLRFLGALALMFAMLPGFANAAYTLEFGQNGVAGITDFSAAVGSTIEIELYITQSDGDTLLTDKGIATLAMTFDIDGAGGAIHDNNEGVSTYVFPAGFPDGQVADLSNGFQTLTLDANTGGTGVQPEAGSNSVLLGTAQIQVNSAGVYNLAMARDGGLAFVTPDLDIISPGNGVGTITAVPEPGSFAVLGLCAGSGALVRWRRRRQAAAAV